MTKTQYEVYLSSLHAEARQTAAGLLEYLEKQIFSRKGLDHDLLLMFELIRQIAHRATNGNLGASYMIQTIRDEVNEIHDLMNDGWSDVDLDAYRAMKDEKLAYLGSTFLQFWSQQRFGDYPSDGPDFRTPEQKAWDQAKEELFRDAESSLERGAAGTLEELTDEGYELDEIDDKT